LSTKKENADTIIEWEGERSGGGGTALLARSEMYTEEAKEVNLRRK